MINVFKTKISSSNDGNFITFSQKPYVDNNKKNNKKLNFQKYNLVNKIIFSNDLKP